MQGQGQGSGSNPFPGNFYFNNDGIGSNQANNALANGGTSSMRPWIGQSSSTLDTQNHVSTFGQFIGDDFWLSPLGDQARTNQGVEERHSNEPTFNPFLQINSISPSSTFNPFLESNSMNQGNGQISSEHAGPIGPSSVLPAGQETSSGPLQQNIDINVVAHEGSGIDHASTHQDNGPYLSLDLFRSRTSAGDHLPTSHGDSSSPVMIYSGVAGYVLEENVNREGLPTDGQRRLLCKRRAPEFASGQVTSGESSSSAWQAGNSGASGYNIAQDNVISSVNASSSLNINRLNSRPSGALAAQPPPPPPPPPPPSNLYQAAALNYEAGQVDNFQRNTRLRRTNPTPVNLWTTTWNSSSNSNVQVPTGQPAPVFSPFGRFTITSSALALTPAPAPAPVPVINPAMQPMPVVQIPSPLLAPQHPQIWNAANMTQLVGSSSTSPDQTANIRDAFDQQEENLRNNRRNMMIPMANMQANLYLASANPNVFGNMASSSRINQPGSGMYLPTSTMRTSQPNMVERYAQRVQEIINQSEAWRQGNYCPIHSVPPPAVRDMDVSMRGGNARSSQVAIRLGPVAERLAGRPSETPAQRRRRLVRNALELVRRQRGLRLEDVMVINPSFLYAMPEVPDDVHDNMRLDVDNMSYEELLNLEEQIGDVSTGLSEETILANLRRRKYQPITIEPPAEAESCCICQEDYGNGEELGKLDCGHDFHFNCIKPWLVQKNQCPICKKTALAI